MAWNFKVGELKTELLPHQQRVVDRIQRPDQPGLLVVHGLGSGKCVRGDTPVLTDQGLLQMRDLFHDEELPTRGEAILAPRTGMKVLSLVDGALVWQGLRKRFVQRLSNKEHTARIGLNTGLTLDATRAHPILVVDQGRLTWRAAGELKKGDFVAVPDHTVPPQSGPSISPALLDLVTWQAAEGWENPKKSTVMIVQQDDQVLNKLLAAFQQLYPDSASGYIRQGSNGRTGYLEISCKEYKFDLENIGYPWGELSARKALPYWMLSLPDADLAVALRNLFDAEGSATTNCVEFSSASSLLADQVQYALLRFGIRSCVLHQMKHATNGSRVKREYHRINIYGEHAVAFFHLIGFGVPYKQDALRTLVERKRNPNNGVPIQWLIQAVNQIGLTHKHLKFSLNRGRSISQETCHTVIDQLHWLASAEALAYYTRQAASLGGTARDFSKRTANAISTSQGTLYQLADCLHSLLEAPLHYLEVEYVSPGEAGGYVFDLEVDTDNYDHKNYVGGHGGIILHNTLTSIAAQDALKMPATVVAPAALQENYEKEREKHLEGKGRAKIDLTTMQAGALHGQLKPNPLLIVDESLPWEAPILTEEGYVPIGQLVEEGADKRRVACVDESGQVHWRYPSHGWIHRPKSPMVEITHAQGKLRCTANHLILTTGGWVPAARLRTGHILLGFPRENPSSAISPCRDRRGGFWPDAPPQRHHPGTHACATRRSPKRPCNAEVPASSTLVWQCPQVFPERRLGTTYLGLLNPGPKGNNPHLADAIQSEGPQAAYRILGRILLGRDVGVVDHGRRRHERSHAAPINQPLPSTGHPAGGPLVPNEPELGRRVPSAQGTTLPTIQRSGLENGCPTSQPVHAAKPSVQNRSSSAGTAENMPAVRRNYPKVLCRELPSLPPVQVAYRVQPEGTKFSRSSQIETPEFVYDLTVPDFHNFIVDGVITHNSHRMRDPASKTFKAIRGTPSQKRLLLTGSPFYNRPSDIAPLINAAAGNEVLPSDPTKFTERFVLSRKVAPGLWDRLHGVRPGEVEGINPRHAPELRQTFGKWIDYHPGSTEDFPEVSREDVRVPMSAQQHQFYRTSLAEAPPSIARKIEAGLPPSKSEKALMGAFLSGARQISNTPEPFQTAGTVPSPKIEEAVKRLQGTLSENPRAKAVVYSNFLGAGIDPYRKKLEELGIPHGAFTGEMRPDEREQMVRDYNEGKIRALLLSGAGGEGLDLRGTRLMQILEPAWNEERIKQVEGRGARYKSHADLSPEERNVKIERYLATIPEWFLTRASRKILPTSLQPKKKTSTDEYLANMSTEKDRLIQEFKGLFPQAAPPSMQQKVAAAKAKVVAKLAEGKETYRSRFAGQTPPGWEEAIPDTPLRHAPNNPFDGDHSPGAEQYYDAFNHAYDVGQSEVLKHPQRHAALTTATGATTGALFGGLSGLAAGAYYGPGKLRQFAGGGAAAGGTLGGALAYLASRRGHENAKKWVEEGKQAEAVPDDRRVVHEGRSISIKELVQEMADRIRAAARGSQKQAESMPDEYLQSYALSGDGHTPGFALPQQTFGNSSAIMPLMPGPRGLGSFKAPPMVRLQKKSDGGF